MSQERCPRCGCLTSGTREGGTEYCTACGGELGPAYTPVQTIPDECPACLGYGHFTEEGEPSSDRRDRKCLDCRGTGER
jgi:hypothetical protein